MKNNSTGKNFGTVFSIIAAIVVAVIFWLVVKYIDETSVSAFNTAADIWAAM